MSICSVFLLLFVAMPSCEALVAEMFYINGLALPKDVLRLCMSPLVITEDKTMSDDMRNMI